MELAVHAGSGPMWTDLHRSLIFSISHIPRIYPHGEPIHEHVTAVMKDGESCDDDDDFSSMGDLQPDSALAPLSIDLPRLLPRLIASMGGAVHHDQ